MQTGNCFLCLCYFMLHSSSKIQVEVLELLKYLKARFGWQGKIQQFYDIDKKKIGEGSYGSVCKARNKAKLEGKRERKVTKTTDEYNDVRKHLVIHIEQLVHAGQESYVLHGFSSF